MATKSAAKKKTAAKSGSKKTTTTKVVSNKKSVNLPVGVLAEREPDNHKVTGKYTFFYVLFACTTLIFAGVAVWLFVFSSNLLNKYESIEAHMLKHNLWAKMLI